MAMVTYDGGPRPRPREAGRRTGQVTAGYQPYEDGGITGPKPGLDPPAPDPTTPSAPTTPTAPNPFNIGRTAGLDAGKFADPNKHGFKYDTMRALSAFDPRGGFTADVLKALNALGYGTFSSRGGDKLSLTGATGSPEAADFTDQDWIFAHDAQNDATKWSFGGGGFLPPSPQVAAYGPDPTPTFSMPSPGIPGYAGGFYPYPNEPQAPQMPPIFSDPQFWQQLVAAMQPQYQAGYSNAPTPTFGGAQYGGSRPPVQQQNPQIQQLLSQLFAGMMGGR